MVVQSREGSLPEPDVASVLSLLGDAVSGRVLRALEGTGLRHGHGYLIQRLVVGPATATEIASELGISQQAVSKAVRELSDLGHVELGADPADARRRPVRLTTRGRRAVEAARTERQRIDEQLRASLGGPRFEETRLALLDALEALGLGEQVRRRAVPPPTPDLS
jgi:DNA-binding MarR family transcriptional regulator